jgi:hypothetical protein
MTFFTFSKLKNVWPKRGSAYNLGLPAKIVGSKVECSGKKTDAGLFSYKIVLKTLKIP